MIDPLMGHHGAFYIYGMALNPNCTCVFIVTQIISWLEDSVPFISIIGSGVYGLITFWLLLLGTWQMFAMVGIKL